MDQATHNKIVSFIWGIADDVLRDLFKRGKYPDVILPMFVLRRMDAVLEPTKKAVLETKEMLDKAAITEQRAALAAAAGQSFYNTSRFLQVRLAQHAHRQIPRSRNQSQSRSRPQCRPHRATPRHGQSLHGHGLRGTGPQVQRGKQRGGRRALDTRSE